jgi:transcriptional regulator with PAS, ATPase and Fis domain
VSGRDSHHNDPTIPFAGGDAAERRWLLVIHNGESTPVELLPRTRLTVGRLESSDIHVADPAVSRTHAEIEAGPPVRIRDMGSQNGVRVRQRKLDRGEWAELGPGDSAQIGPVTLVLQAGTELPASSSAVAPSERKPTASSPQVFVSDPAMRELFDLVAVVAASEINILILGETGVGKEVIADAVHRGSPRASKPFLRLNCAALSPTLLESELFGHEKGSFTGAQNAKPGLLETASGGTVFLDEIGEMPLALQAKLLRVLEERAVMRVGALSTRPIDVRFVAATHRDLKREIATGVFRQDLYFRLNGISLIVPPLRERVGEIEGLARYFASRAPSSARRGGGDVTFAPETLARLRAYEWPGNIRELRNVIERAVLLAGASGVVTATHLPSEINERAASSRPGAPVVASDGSASASGKARSRGDIKRELEEIEKQRIIDALEQCQGNQSRAAELIGMPRRTFLARLEAYGLPRPRKVKPM